MTNIQYPISNIKSRLSNIQYPISNIVLGFLMVIGFFYRVYGLNANHSFWTDENHLAIFARAILERGKPILANGYSTGIYQTFPYYLSAFSAKIFGLNEFAIRFPSVIFGVLTIWAVYLLGKELFNKNVGLVAATLITFLKIEILWSRQARPYQALQFFYLLGAWFLYKLSKKDKFEWKYFAGFLGCGILASLMHGLGFVVFFSGFFYLLIFKTSWFKKKWMLLGILLFLFFGWIFRVPVFSVFSQIGKINNNFYYRVFLTHNYLLLCLLAFLGGIFLIWRKNYQKLILFIIFLGVQIVIVSFFLGQPFTRYFYIVFPFIVILASYGIWILDIRNWKKYPVSNIQYLVSGIFIFLVIFSLWKSDKLSFLPQATYSLNEDMQEIPEVDWKKIYNFVGEKLSQDENIILITNWNDLPVWYLGEGRLNYLVRKEKIEKDPFSGAMILSNLDSFRELVKTKKEGLIIIDSWDNYIPDGVAKYCQDSLKKELEVDRLYPVQPRLWPVEVYSWGI